MIKKQVIQYPLVSNKLNRCIICLPGRGQTADEIVNVCSHFNLPNTLIIGIEAKRLSWYPAPNNSEDQDEAVAGQEPARLRLEEEIKRICKQWSFERSQIALVGHSAGAVMSLLLAAKSDKSFNTVVSMCGAVLDTKNFPKCKHEKTNFLLLHNEDDYCFSWFERYLPMKSMLIENNYNVVTLESEYGGHGIHFVDIINVSNFIGPNLGFKNWVHPKTEG